MAQKKQKKPKEEEKEKPEIEEKPKKKEAPKEAVKAENTVFIGRKPPMSYVTAIITSFAGSSTEKVTLKARGRAITTAVDAAEIARHRFMKDLDIGKITIGTEELQQEEGGTRNVSTIEITLTKTES